MDSAAPFYKQPTSARTRAEPCPTVLLAEPRDSTGSSSPMELQWPHKPAKSDVPQDDNDTPPPISLGLSIRRGRLVAFTVSMVVVIAGLTLFFRHGVALTYFDSHAKNATEQTKLLDDYNSYSGNVASVFAKPIELFVTVAVQVIVLRFMAGTFTRPEMSWKTSAVTLLLGAGIGYLIGNGFNALNVQLRPQEIETMIIPADLFLHTNFTEDNRSTSVLDSVPESRPHNIITNTLLRSAITPKQFRGSTNCGWDASNPTTGAADEVKEGFVNLGFMQRDWQGRILQEAPPSTTMRLIVNPTSEAVNETVDSAKLPMNASLAAELFYHAITMGTSFFPWGQPHAFANRSDIARRYPVSDNKAHELQDSTTKLYGLMPPEEANASDEMNQGKWFLRESVAAMSRQFAFSQRTKRSDLILEFSHTQLTPTIAFDAVTFEVEIDPMLLATAASADNSTRYTVLDPLVHCPVSENCMIEKTSYGLSDTAYDPPAQVFTLGMCLDQNDNEALRTNFTRQNTTTFGEKLDCSPGQGGLASLLTVSIAKRLVADALTQNTTASSNGTSPDPDTATVTNLRKIYSFTVGRLSWEFSDLAKEFNARCAPEDDFTCEGLQIPLSASLDKTVQSRVEQRLVVGIDDLPSDLVASPGGPLGLSRTNLVVLDEPPQSPNASELYEIISGDVLLLHNIGNISWDPVPEETFAVCSPDVEDRLIQTLNNHLYMEHGLQTAYTAAMYFLFMYGSVKDVIRVDASHQSLAFDGNKQAIAVWASTPAQNMWLTLTGCVVLVGGLVAALAKATWFSRKHDALANITQPQAIARVIVDERNYPPLFLHRRVLERQGTGRIDDYAIAGLSLQQQQEEELQHRQRLQDAGMLA